MNGAVTMNTNTISTNCATSQQSAGTRKQPSIAIGEPAACGLFVSATPDANGGLASYGSLARLAAVSMRSMVENSTGLVRCWSNPASSALARSASLPQPVSATSTACSRPAVFRMTLATS